MQEYWYCGKCGSMNRADSGRCYKCRADKATSTAGMTAELRQGHAFVHAIDAENLMIARAHMASGDYVSAWLIGYVTSLVTVLAAASEILYAAIAALHAISRSPGYSPNAFPWFEPPPELLGQAVAGLVIVALILQGSFLCLTSMDSPALGSGTPRFGPFRCAMWPIESVLWAVWGLSTMRCGDRWLLEKADLPSGPDAATDNPPRLLADLLDRLWVPGRGTSGLVSLWGVAWSVLIVIGYLLIFTYVLADIGTRPPFLALLALGSCVFALCFLTLARITFEMARRQQLRERWVLDETRPAEAVPQAVAGTDRGVAPLRLSPSAPATQPAQPPALPSGRGPAAGPVHRFTPIARYQAPDEDVSWSRVVERAPRRESDDQLPAAWQRAVEAAAANKAGRSLIEEAPETPEKPRSPTDGQTIDPGPGSGI